MNDHRHRRLDRRALEQLLSGAPVDRSAEADRLAAFLAAAAEPARPEETAGEAAALAAFRAARVGGVPAGAVRRPRRGLAKAVSVKMAALSLAATGLGGVALAAGTGALPTPAEDRPSWVELTPSAPPTTAAAGSGKATPGNSGHADPPRHTIPSPSPSPTLSLVELCRDWRELPSGKRRDALETPRFAPLVPAAGAKKKVAKYCRELTTTAKPSPTPTGTPSPEADTNNDEDDENRGDESSVAGIVPLPEPDRS